MVAAHVCGVGASGAVEGIPPVSKQWANVRSGCSPRLRNNRLPRSPRMVADRPQLLMDLLPAAAPVRPDLDPSDHCQRVPFAPAQRAVSSSLDNGDLLPLEEPCSCGPCRSAPDP